MGWGHPTHLRSGLVTIGHSLPVGWGVGLRRRFASYDSDTMSKPKSTRNALSTKSRAGAAALLNQTLAELFDLYSQCKQAHWNVRGPRFYSLHLLFDQLALAALEPIDDVAERITALGGVALGTVRHAAGASGLKEIDASGDDAYVMLLAERFGAVGNRTREAVDALAKLEDAGSADLLTEVSRALDKALWMLEAHEKAK